MTAFGLGLALSQPQGQSFYISSNGQPTTTFNGGTNGVNGFTSVSDTSSVSFSIGRPSSSNGQFQPDTPLTFTQRPQQPVNTFGSPPVNNFNTPQGPQPTFFSPPETPAPSFLGTVAPSITPQTSFPGPINGFPTIQPTNNVIPTSNVDAFPAPGPAGNAFAPAPGPTINVVGPAPAPTGPVVLPPVGPPPSPPAPTIVTVAPVVNGGPVSIADPTLGTDPQLNGGGTTINGAGTPDVTSDGGLNPECYSRTCDQFITGRDLPYARALEIVQQEEYLEEADFNIIRRKRDIENVLSRQRRQQTNGPATVMETILPTVNMDGNVTTFLDPRVFVSVGLVALLGGLALTQDTQDDDDVIFVNPPVPTFDPTPVQDDPVTVFVVTPPPGQVPDSEPQPGTPGGGSLPIPNTPEAQEAISLAPPGTIPVAVFPVFVAARRREAVCVTFSESDERSIAAQGFDPSSGQIRSASFYKRRSKRQIRRFIHRKILTPISRISRLLRRGFSRRGRYGFRRDSHQYGGYSNNGNNNGGQRENVVTVERRYGFRCRVSFTERCVLGVTCDLQGNRIGGRRQFTEEFSSDAPSECRTEFTGCN